MAKLALLDSNLIFTKLFFIYYFLLIFHAYFELFVFSLFLYTMHMKYETGKT